ncbi:hypothetical protein MUN78_03405 [Leucobacter allii]|uniref:Uncharacterized protein n=1 Tax=Leucobacter allii TaxID=2932247 RepID=A0ABY4FNN1_9MICO|nr:hypothetical protein [Leucobacter allii]UOQ57898.1 hypothetical protein MUN78_03405 [Leucobacter allii]UOR02532.1 hypothetical protein MUN77_04275 [Leucobacter allii]
MEDRGGAAGNPVRREPNRPLNWLALIAVLCFAVGATGIVCIVAAGDTATAVVWGLVTSPALAAGAFSLVAYLAVRALLADRR